MDFLNEEEIKDMVDEVVQSVPRGDDEESDIEKDLEDWVEDEVVDIKCLFNDDIVHSMDELIAHEKDLYGFDLKSVVQSNCGDDVSIIKLLNFIRSKVQQRGSAADKQFIDEINGQIENKLFLEGDEYMKPVIEDDQLLFLYEETFMPDCADETD